jgi:very-short-patch-repair endonuclease
LWQALRDKKVLGVKFRRQHPIDQFIVDFVSLEHLLVIEVDGEIHLGQQAKDAARTARLVELGFKVMRFENQEVLQDMKSVLVRIEHMIQHPAPTPSPSPPGRGAAPLAGAPDGADGVALAATVALTATGDDVVALTATGDDVVALAATGDLMATEGVEVDSGTVDKKSGDEEAVKAAATAVKAATSAEQGAANAAEQAATPLPRGEGPGVGFGFGYHLLWGPPGTGKTSVMLRDMAAAVLRDTTDNLLILAYTNRAVDEICEALQTIGGDIERQYLRIGSRHATAERFRGQLLQHKIAGAKTRAELRSVLDSHRVFVSTLASFSQNEGLTRLKKFQRLIVDEASQILEPQIIGLLTRFEHFTLIGDHRQLPAVTAQRPESTRVADEELLGIGLTDLRESYFERLYRRCISQGWHWAYDQLQRQGRMHRDIMDFPNRHFYGGMLQTLEGPAGERQHQALDHAASALPTEDTPLAVLRQKRVVFLDCPPMSHAALHRKTSLEEAEVAARIVLFFKNLYEKTGKPWRAGHTLGIITPWRAQIAQLRSTLSAAGIDPDALTIDTVERYQGGARDIIILSTCVHTPQQLDSLVSMGEGGVDRKLNVALTRAREQLIMLGNADILRLDERYRAFIEAYG